MTALSTEEKRNQPQPDAAAQLVEVGRRTEALECTYTAARADLLFALRTMNEGVGLEPIKRRNDAQAAFDAACAALTAHLDLWTKRAMQAVDAGVVVSPDFRVEFRHPIEPQPVTLEEIRG